jgi:hypothetical protein
MIETNPAIPTTSVWTHLADEHDTTVSYGAIRAYITKRKLNLAKPGTAAHDFARGEAAPVEGRFWQPKAVIKVRET